MKKIKVIENYYLKTNLKIKKSLKAKKKKKTVKYVLFIFQYLKTVIKPRLSILQLDWDN